MSSNKQIELNRSNMNCCYEYTCMIFFSLLLFTFFQIYFTFIDDACLNLEVLIEPLNRFNLTRHV